MKNQIRPLFTAFALLIIFTGVIYPLLVTGLSQAFFSFQANGSIIQKNGRLVGSQLIGQNFSGSKYFWGRPSATSGSPYTAFDPLALTGSSGSNLGPLSLALVSSVKERVNYLHSDGHLNYSAIPVDLVTTSGSGLDPHISVASAYYQVPRIANNRGLAQQDVTELIIQLTENRQFGILGEPRINVLILNLALDGIK